MKKIILSIVPLLMVSFQTYSNSFDSSSTSITNYADALFNTLQQDQEFANAPNMAQQYAKILVQDITSDPKMWRDYQNGDLVLDDNFVADYFLKDTVKTIGTTIIGAGSSAISFIKELAGNIASLANKALTAVTSSDAVMKFIGGVTTVVNKLLPFGSTVLGAALLTIPGGEALIPALAAVTPVLMKVLTPENVAQALKIAQATTEVADTFLNQAKKDGLAKANRAPAGDLLALEAKSSVSASKKDRDKAGLAYKMGIGGYDALAKFVKRIGKRGWEKLSKADKETLSAALNKGAAVLTLIDPKKLR